VERIVMEGEGGRERRRKKRKEIEREFGLPTFQMLSPPTTHVESRLMCKVESFSTLVT